MRLIISLVALLLAPTLTSAKPIEQYLPADEMFDASIPTPAAVLGQELGDKHLRHDQIVSYLSVLAASRPEAKLIDYGRSNEGRRLILLAISSADNIKQMDRIKSDPDVLKVWTGFGVHGNESSSQNAAVLFAWYLLATNNNAIKNSMQDTVVLIDPTLNPDGYERFANYVNNMRSLTTVTDPNDLSHIEPWPNGRTNHYWFDLNRDWLLLTQAESKARIEQFHAWQPHVMTDHHEMGSAASFFFQPGVPSRKNPLISEKNVDLTTRLAKYHAEALDQVGQFYYKQESFDDFYPGKGSTYPDLQGSIGILFEQARAMGGVIDTINGQRTLADGIRNQFLTARSTVMGSLALRQELIDYKRNFFSQAKQAAAKMSTKGYLIDVANRDLEANRLMTFLGQHRIEYAILAADKTVDGHKYQRNSAIYIPLNQSQTTLVQALFMTDTSFQDNTFYDVSAWNLGMAWGLQWDAVTSNLSTQQDAPAFKPNNSYKKDAIAYVFDWHSGNAPAALHYLSQQGEDVYISGKAFSIDGHNIPAGSFVLPVNQQTDQDQLFSTLSTITDAFAVQWYALSTAWADQGIDLGSPNVRKLNHPKVLMLVGQGVNAYQAGTLWHLFDTQVYLPITKVRLTRFPQVDLDDYTHIIMPNGSYNSHLNEAQTNKLNTWVRQGGHLIALQGGAKWVEDKLKKQTDQKADQAGKKDDTKASEGSRKPYAEYEKDVAEKVLGGAIVAADADLTHPLAFGSHLSTQFALMRGRHVLEKPEATEHDIFHVPLQVADQVRAAGYVSDYWFEKLQHAPLVVAEKMGRGTVIKFGFGPNFRAFWYGTQRWIINAIFMTDLIRNTQR